MFRSLYIISQLKNKSPKIHEHETNFVPLVKEHRNPKIVRVPKNSLYNFISDVSQMQWL